MLVGTVGASMAANGDLLVTYNVTKPGVFLLETHLDVFTSPAQLQAAGKLKNGNVAPGKLAFKQSFSLATQMQVYTVTVPKADLDRAVGANTNCFFVASHAALSNGETAWGGMCSESTTGTTSLGSALQFTGSNWGVYFEFCKSACTQRAVDFTYAWEDLDLDGDANDRDYNDLVIKSSVMRSPSNLRMKFTAVARGAAFDHQFKIKIPMLGITGIFGTAGQPAPNVYNDGTYYYITAFENTKYQLPGSGTQQFSNTIATDPCVPFAVKEIVLETNSSFVYSATRPYEPLITVIAFSPNRVYDLYVQEISTYRDDTWTATNGQRYPNGIVIPADWRWPLEGIAITGPYPTFRSLNDPLGFNFNWASVPLTSTAAFLALTNNGGACAN